MQKINGLFSDGTEFVLVTYSDLEKVQPWIDDVDPLIYMPQKEEDTDANS